MPGVDAGALASVKSAMFTDGCPLVSSISGVSLAQCYAYTGGPQHGGLLGVTTKLLSLGQALNQAKADQVAAAQAAAALVPAEGLAFSASATLTSGSAATFQALGRRVLAPAFAYIVSGTPCSCEERRSRCYSLLLSSAGRPLRRRGPRNRLEPALFRHQVLRRLHRGLHSVHDRAAAPHDITGGARAPPEAWAASRPAPPDCVVSLCRPRPHHYRRRRG